MDSDTIDLIYQNEAVEGVAIFDGDNQLIENQLSLAVGKVLVIAKTLHELKRSLENAGREMRGFVIKTESILLHVCMFPDKLVLLELSDDSSVNEVDRALRSTIGTVDKPKKAAALPAQTEKAQKPTLPAQPEPAAEEIENGIDLADFKNSLYKMLKSVAPGKLAESMMNAAMKDMDLDVNAVQLPQDVATELGYKVIDRIPNKARRQIIEKEYTTLIKSDK